MEVESGFHKFIGYYKALPDLLERAGIDLDDMLVWETTMEVRHPNVDEHGEFGLDVIHAPLKTLSGVLGNNNFITPADKASLIPFLAAGFKECVSSPEELDSISVLDFANQHGVSEQALQRIVEPLSSGIFSCHLINILRMPSLACSCRVFLGFIKCELVPLLAA